MKQTARIISTYSADVFGVCSALFELGGMVVMHDASGCNSTYTTHDEPRWYDMDSMIYISGLTEMEAIMGDDEKLVEDIAAAAKEMHPRFIAVAGTPIPAMTGFDFASIAMLIEQRTGIPAFGFSTTGMNTYVQGASMALEAYARRFASRDAEVLANAENAEDTECGEHGEKIPVNILGMTPLDFSVNGSDESMVEMLKNAGFQVLSRWAMGSMPKELSKAGNARANLVVSAAGLGAAKAMEEMFGIPYVVGTPVGKKVSAKLAELLKIAAECGENQILWKTSVSAGTDVENSSDTQRNVKDFLCAEADEATEFEIMVIGEGITSLSLAAAIELETGKKVRVLCATECEETFLRERDALTMDEEEIEEALNEGMSEGMKLLIADPLYRPVCPKETGFAALPTEAFSGRIYRKEIPNLVTGFEHFIKGVF